MTEREDPIRRRKRWEAFYREEGGIRDMLGAIRAEYFLRMSKCDPGHVAQITNLAIAGEITNLLDQAVQAIIAEGQIAEKAQERIDKIQSIPDYKRRWAQGF